MEGDGFKTKEMVVTQLPDGTRGEVVVEVVARGPWQAGFCDCLKDTTSCAISCCVPCWQYGQNVRQLHFEASPPTECIKYCCLSCCGLQFILGMMTRGEIRNKYNIEGSPVMDCLVHCCLPCCSLSQEHRELKLHTIIGSIENKIQKVENELGQI